MLNNSAISTALIVVSGFLLSLLSLFVTDPFCRQVQASKLAKAGKLQTELIIRDLNAKIAAVAQTGKRFSRPEHLSRDDEPTQEMKDAITELLQLPGVFTVEVARQESPPTSAAQLEQNSDRKNRSGKVMRKGRFPSTYRVFAIDSNRQDVSKFVGTERIYPIIRMVYQSGGTMISRPHAFYEEDGLRTGIATTLGPHEQTPIGLLVVTFEELIASELLKSELISLTASEINLSNQAARMESDDYQVIRSSERTYESQAKIGERVFQFVVTERPGANLHPHWIKWASFLLCNAGAYLVGLSWLQRGRAELLQRNCDLEVEIERRNALQKHLQATIDFRDHERELIAHEIHDGFVQDIIGAQMFAESSLSLAEEGTTLQRQATAVTELLRNAISEARKTIDYLKPRVVDEVGLVAALQSSVDSDRKNYNFHTKLCCDEDIPRLPILVERMLYRIIREAVSNARQHSGQNAATISVRADSDKVIAEVTDEGSGFDEKQVRTDSFGLPGIRQRIEMLNGKMQLHTSEFGTKLAVEIPRDLESPSPITNQSLMLKI